MEIIVVDDCSSDGTPEMITSLHDARVRLIRNPHPLGVAGSRNAGLSAAAGTWVAFTDDDDLWSPRKLAQQLAALHAEPGAGWCVVGAVVVNQEWEIRQVQLPRLNGDVASLLLAANVVPGGGSGVLANRELVHRAGAFDRDVSMFADWDLWIRLALLSPVVTVPEPLVVKVRHSHNMSLDTSQSLAELSHVSDKYAGERLARGVRSRHQEMLLWIASGQAAAGSRLAAVRTCLLAAWRERTLHPLRRAALSAVGSRAVVWRERARVHHLSPETQCHGRSLLHEIAMHVGETGLYSTR